jgi:hypothetical protein
MSRRFYLCAPYRRREEMLRCAGDLEALGHEVSSRWIRGNRQELQTGSAGDRLVHDPMLEAVRQEIIGENLGDLGGSQALIHFSDAEPDPRGTRHVELGIALALELDVIVIGRPENIFHQSDFVARFDSWAEFLAGLAPARIVRASVATCRVCGCTDEKACDGGCSWTEPDLCSTCAGLAIIGP